MTIDPRFQGARWVAIVDGRLVVRTLAHDPRPLTFMERLAWRLFKRVPPR